MRPGAVTTSVVGLADTLRPGVLVPLLNKVTLIAEVSSNHGGSVRSADLFIKRFAEAGADIVKFQLTRAHRLRLDDPQKAWFEQAELDIPKVRQLTSSCLNAGARPMFTIYHPDDVWEVAHLPIVKIGAGESHAGALAARVLAEPFTTIYVSEGIRPAHASYVSDSRVKMLGTCARYPAPIGLVAQRFGAGKYDGWSDHSIGLDESHLAVVMGATVIERHVQIREQARDPRPFELTVDEFRELRRRVDENPDRFLGRWNG